MLVDLPIRVGTVVAIAARAPDCVMGRASVHATVRAIVHAIVISIAVVANLVPNAAASDVPDGRYSLGRAPTTADGSGVAIRDRGGAGASARFQRSAMTRSESG